MSALLEDRVAAWVADHPGRRAVEIARGVAGRYASVLKILESPVFVVEQVGRSRRYSLAVGADDWRISVVGGGRLARRRFSQCAAIVAALESNGRGWISTAAIHKLAGSSRLNSRISELRKRGFVIAHRHAGGVGPRAHEYQLLGRPGEKSRPSSSRRSSTKTAARTKSTAPPPARRQPTPPELPRRIGEVAVRSDRRLYAGVLETQPRRCGG